MRSHAKAGSAVAQGREAQGPGRLPSSVRRLPPSLIAALAALTLLLTFAFGTSGAQAAPSATIKPVADPTITTAALEGSVTTEAGEAETYAFFQYSPLGTNHCAGEPPCGPLEQNENWSQAPGFVLLPENATTTVTDTVSGLNADTDYEARLSALSLATSVQRSSEVEAFTTDPAPVKPTFALELPTAIGFSKATLAATIDPEGGNKDPGISDPPSGLLAIHWEIQLHREGEESEGSPVWNNYAEGDLSNQPVEVEPGVFDPPPAESSDPIEVKAEPTGLVPGAKYEFRVRALYAGTEALSELGEFTLDPVDVPTVSIKPAEEVTGEGAHFAGTVQVASADEDFNADCRFDYVSDAKFQVDAFASAAQVPCEPSPIAGTAETPVSADVALEPNTTYHLRIVATNKGGSSEALAPSFKTVAVKPVIAPEVSTPEGPGEVTIRAFVNPRNSAITECHFEYGLDTSYGQSAPCEGDPNGPGTNEGLGFPPPARVFSHLTGLDPGATYHFRLSATNVADTVGGPDQRFDTPSTPSAQPCQNAGNLGTSFLPDCRAWEMVSPPGKNGGDILANNARTRSAADGGAVQFSSLASFRDVVGTGVAVDYMSVRRADSASSDNGWDTHAITPPQNPLTVNAVTGGGDPRYTGEFSPDLDQGVFRAWTPLTSDAATGEAINFYLRDDLRSPGPGHYQLLTACPLCAVSEQSVPPLNVQAAYATTPVYGGASSDFRHLVFERPFNLTAGAPAQPACTAEEPFACNRRAYEWVDGEVQYVGLIPPEGAIACGSDGTPCEPAQPSLLGQGGRSANAPLRLVNVISDDGLRVFFTIPIANSTGNLFMRHDGATTVKLNASERTDCAGDLSCGGDGVPDLVSPNSAPAEYLMATPDGSRVFFYSGGALTDDSSGGSGLYMYDTTKPPADPHNLTRINVDHEPADNASNFTAIIGVGGEGRYVYFVATGQDVRGEPLLAGNRGLFAWHAGHLSFIGAIDFDKDRDLTLNGLYNNPTQAGITEDGRHLVVGLHDGSGLALAHQHDGRRELYFYSADTHSLKCVSCDPNDVVPKRDAATGIRANGGGSSTDSHLHRAISEDGRYVFFTTQEALLPEDTNGAADAYEYDSYTNALHLLSSGTDPSASYFMESDPGGSNAFILTRERLSKWDTDTAYDLYDARVEGGVPEPSPRMSPCSADSCRDAVPVGPTSPSTASVDVHGANDPRPIRRRCHRGRHVVKHHGKARCLKAPPKRRRANESPKEGS